MTRYHMILVSVELYNYFHKSFPLIGAPYNVNFPANESKTDFNISLSAHILPVTFTIDLSPILSDVNVIVGKTANATVGKSRMWIIILMLEN